MHTRRGLTIDVSRTRLTSLSSFCQDSCQAVHLEQGGVRTTKVTAVDKMDASVEVFLRLKVPITLIHSNLIALIQKEGVFLCLSIVMSLGKSNPCPTWKLLRVEAKSDWRWKWQFSLVSSKLAFSITDIGIPQGVPVSAGRTWLLHLSDWFLFSLKST